MKKLSTKKELAIIIILILLALTPFSKKAFHVDDPLVIYPVQQILKSPLHPFDFDVNWYGLPQSMWELTNPPFIFYYLAPLVAIFGEKEAWLHLSYLIFSVIAGISIYFLGKRFTKNPLLSALLLIATPAFLVTATSVMPDIPFLAFYLLAVVIYIQAQDRNSKPLAILSGVLIGLTCLTKYTGLTLIPLLLLYSLLKRRRLSQTVIALGLGLLLFGLWCWYSKVFYGHLQPIEVCQYFNFGKEAILHKTLGTLSYIGGGTIFPLLFFLLCKKKKDILIYLLAILLTILLSLKTLLRFQYTAPQIILFTFFASLGLFFCIKGVLQKFWRDRDGVFLLVWFFGILLFNIIIEFAAVRYVLVLVPPMILLLMRGIEGVPKLKKILPLGIILTLLLGLLVSYGDYRYANCYRDFAQEKAANFKEEGIKVWFRGHWGFQYYMEKEGFEYLATDRMPIQGDLIIMPSIVSHEPFSKEINKGLRLIDVVTYQTFFPIRTMHQKEKAGFYSQGWGFLPYAFSKSYLEKFRIYRFEGQT